MILGSHRDKYKCNFSLSLGSQSVLFVAYPATAPALNLAFYWGCTTVSWCIKDLPLIEGVSATLRSPVPGPTLTARWEERQPRETETWSVASSLD